MRCLWLVGLAVVLGLMLVPTLQAAEESGGETSAPAVTGDTGGGETQAPAERGRRRGMPTVTLTKEQEEALAPAVEELKAAVAKFKAAVVAVLGEENAQTYVVRTIFSLVRPAREQRPAAEGESTGTGEGTGGERPRRMPRGGGGQGEAE